MSNFSAVLKAEVARLARKEVRAASESFRKAAATNRKKVAALTRQVHELEKQLNALKRVTLAPSAKKNGDVDSVGVEGKAGSLRFRASGMAANRKRLGLSAADFGLLVGASGQSVYLWEQGR